jgi:hypothetical protein
MRLMTVDTLPPTSTTITVKDSTLKVESLTDIAISVRNISKMYPLYAQPSDRLKQSLWYALPSPADFSPRHPGDSATLIASSEAIRRELAW